MTDNSNYIEKKIKELQNDMKLSFKMTDEVIDIVYRQAVEDLKKFDNSNKEPKKERQNKDLQYFDEVEEYTKYKEDFKKYLELRNSSPKRFGNKINDKQQTIDSYIKRERLETYRKVINKIDKSRDLITVYDFCRKEIEKINNDEWLA